MFGVKLASGVVPGVPPTPGFLIQLFGSPPLLLVNGIIY
jgi:hypothetical protein